MANSFYLVFGLTSVLLAIIVGIMNLLYFFIVKTKWRWIKLIYFINAILVGWMVYTNVVVDQNIFSLNNEDILLMSIIILQTTLFGGTMVSFAKLRDAGVDIKAEIRFLFGR